MNRLHACCILFISLLLTLSIPSCKKDNNTIVVEGIVNDPNTGIKVEGVTVVFSSSKITDGVYNSGYQEISRTTTDAGGNFRFEMEEERTSGYRITLSKTGYFSVNKDISADDIKAGTVYSPSFDIYPVGYIKLHVINQNPIDSSDFISYTFSAGYLGCYECCDNSMRYGYGETVDDWLKCKTYGNQNVTITWNVTKAEGSMQHNAVVYCKANDTVTYEIYY